MPSLIRSETQRYALLGAFFGILFPLGATTIRILDAGLPVTISSFFKVQSTDSLLWIIDTAPLFLGIFAGIAGYRQDNLRKTNLELLNIERELRNIQASLEVRVEQRTRELTEANLKAEKRADQLKAIAEIARAAITFQDLNELLHQLADLIGEQLGFYHVGIFLLDDGKNYAILRAANSEGGQKMLARSHRLRVGDQGIVGYVTHSGNPRIALDVGADAVFFNNPDLPDTHSEVSLPLKFGTEIIGALDIQSRDVNAFSDVDVEIFSILADQISVAILNIRSWEQTRRALQEAELASNQLTGQAWKVYADALRTSGYRYDGTKPQPLRKRRKAAPESEDDLNVPVQLRGRTIGRLKLKSIDKSRKWTEDELAVIESTAERVALAIDNARLLEAAQQRAAREAFLSDLGARIGTSFQLDSILRDTVEELGQALEDSTVTFQLVDPTSPSSGGSEAGRSSPASANSE